eukprot:COSAG06_NODE_9363_length_1920_cov_1.813839_1_plen_219_part_10
MTQPTNPRKGQPAIAGPSGWDGSMTIIPSIDQNQQPFPQTNVEDPFLWRDIRGHFHMLHHWQSGNRNAYANGGHSFSPDGVRWTFSNATAYTKNISWTATGPNINNTQPWTLMARRERPGLLLNSKWETPLALFSAVAAHTWRRNVLPRWAEAHQSCVRRLKLNNISTRHVAPASNLFNRMVVLLRARRWLQSQPIRQKLGAGEAAGGGGACTSDESCN